MSDAMIPGEDASHDAALLALQLKLLVKGSSPDEFSARVTYALENHIPFLERPFANETSISGWVVKQVPLEHGIEVRGMFNALSAGDKSDPHGVASKLVEIMAQAREPLEELKAGSLSEFVGVTTEEAGGRRPSGMQPGGQPGRDRAPLGRGRGRGRGRGESGGNLLKSRRPLTSRTPGWFAFGATGGDGTR